MAIVKRQEISVGEDVEKVESSYIAGGNIKQAATLENSFHCKGYIQKKWKHMSTQKLGQEYS